MPTWEVIRQEDAEYPVPGFEGDVLGGGPITIDVYACSAGFDQPRDNWLKIHGAHDYPPRTGGRRDLLVEAVAAGRPEWFQRWNGVSGPGGGYGNALLIRHDDGEATLSGHLEEFAPRIEDWIRNGALASEAPYLEAGEVIGRMGNTGNVWPTPQVPEDRESGKHLHLEVRTRPELGSVLVDPGTRIRVIDAFPIVGEPETPAEPNPTPNQPLDFTYTNALDEARLLLQQLVDLQAHPPAGDAYQFALEVVAQGAALIGQVPEERVVREMQQLGTIVEFLETNRLEYGVMIGMVAKELTETLVVLQDLVPGSVSR